MDAPVPHNHADPRLALSYDDLLGFLTREIGIDKVNALFRCFGKSTTNNRERFEFCYNCTEIQEYLDGIFKNNCSLKLTKNNQAATKLKKLSVLSYRNHELDKCLSLLQEAILQADDFSDILMVSYGNRSACLFEMQHYEEAVKDIDVVMEEYVNSDSIDKSTLDAFLAKLLDRKKRCLNNLDEEKAMTDDDGLGIIDVLEKHNSLLTSFGLSDKVEICFDSDFGHHVKAKQAINVGDVVVVERAFSRVVVYEYRSMCCYFCLKIVQHHFVPCKYCTVATYCSLKCRQDDVINHGMTCSILNQHVYGVVSPLQHLALQTLIQSDRPGYEDIERLVGHIGSRSNVDLMWRTVVALYIYRCIAMTSTANRLMTKDRASLGGKLIEHLYSLPCNAHELCRYGHEGGLSHDGLSLCNLTTHEFGAGIYHYLSMFNHSCDPDVTRNFVGDVCVVRAIKYIKPGQQVFDQYSYHYATLSRQFRQESLKSQYLFDCWCQACSENWPIITDMSDNQHAMCCHHLAPKQANVATGNERSQMTFEAGSPSVDRTCSVCRSLTVKADTKLKECCDLLMNNGNLSKSSFQSSRNMIRFLCLFIQLSDQHDIIKPWYPYNRAQETLKKCFNSLLKFEMPKSDARNS